MSQPLRPAVFFDRDGVLNEDVGYLHKIEEFRWVPGAMDAIRMANDRGWLVFIVTNQSGIARGYYPQSQVQSLHDWMEAELKQHGAHIDDIRLCPHMPDQGCDCRKPMPGMILDLCAHWPVDKTKSIMIGDKDSDREAAEAAGIKGYFYQSHMGALDQFLLKII